MFLKEDLNYWFDTILNPQKPASTSPDEEFAKYDFRKSAGQALGGGGLTAQTPADQSIQSAKPVIKPAAKKKKASGGC